MRSFLLAAGLVLVVMGAALANMVQGTPPSSVPSGSILPSGQNWVLVFDDEFNGSSIDTNKWVVPCDGCAGRGGDILRTSQVTTFDGSHMVFTELPDGTGGEVSSQQSFGQGYYEARLQPGDGWSVFWTISNQNDDCFGDRTNGFESDIYENITNGGQSNTHWNGYGSCHQSEGCADYGIDPNSEHVFGMWWQDDHLLYYVDGELRCDVQGPNGNPTSGGLLHTIVLTVASTQNGGAASIPMKTDWVRFYQLQ
jgi:beta-glucanase (GH16 family)